MPGFFEQLVELFRQLLAHVLHFPPGNRLRQYAQHHLCMVGAVIAAAFPVTDTADEFVDTEPLAGAGSLYLQVLADLAGQLRGQIGGLVATQPRNS